MLQEQLIEEIKQIPNEKLAEIYDLIHYFRLGLAQEKSTGNIHQSSIGLEKKQLKQKTKQRSVGEYAGKIVIHDDFDDPMPDSFWLGDS